MKSRLIIATLFLSLFVASCKDEKKEELPTESTPEVVVENKNIFKVTLNARVKMDDSFQIFYKDAEGDPFEEKNSFFVEFKGNEQPQDIIFNLPEDVLPNYLRLDFGTNKTQKEITINSFKINYLDKAFEAKGKDFFDYFYSNDLIKADVANAKVTPITKDGNYDPIFCSAEGLKKQIEILIQ